MVLLPAGDGVVNPLESLRALARRLEAAHVADPGNDRVARELRATLMALSGVPEPAEDPLGELRALAAGVS